MVTLYRMLKTWQIRIKWRLALWQYIDQQATEIIRNPHEFEKKLVSYIAKSIHNASRNGGAN